MIPQTTEQLAALIDHTLLKADTPEADIRRLCEEALQYGFYGVCVSGRWVKDSAAFLKGSGVKIISVAGFPLGADTTEVKVFNAAQAIEAGADEIDMVADIAAIKAGDENCLAEEFNEAIKTCRAAAKQVLLKVIIESACLTDEQIKFVCGIADEAGVDFVKTSTGFHPAGGASVHAVELMRKAAPHCKVKASGGIRTADQAIAMLRGGASRLGTSASLEIIEEFSGK